MIEFSLYFDDNDTWNVAFWREGDFTRASEDQWTLISYASRTQSDIDNHFIVADHQSVPLPANWDIR